MEDVTLALALHVVAIVVWIGGVGLVTTVLLPTLRRLPDAAQRIAVFEAVERRFSSQARFAVLLVGASGLYMLVRMDAWNRFASPAYWWMHAMVLVWLIFATLLFVLEPLILRRRFAERAKADPTGTLRTLQRVHWGLLLLSLLTILGTVAGSHGLLFFD
ncbi:Uncharacterized membrane protein [Rhizobiales bacterium GAS113]|nr:Uncharacterized membrane protein [Rhizobiales bacterium GAS113]